MAWIVDTYAATLPPQERYRALAVVTGKPVSAGGSVGREKATGQGVVDLIEMWASDHACKVGDLTYTVQGFGKVGSWAARILKDKSAKLLAVQDVTGAIKASTPAGLDADALAEHVKKTGGVAGFPGAEAVMLDAFFGVQADVFIPPRWRSRLSVLRNNGPVAEGQRFDHARQQPARYRVHGGSRTARGVNSVRDQRWRSWSARTPA
jgi:glutamate dehydrogenase (NAD(P)+)